MTATKTNRPLPYDTLCMCVRIATYNIRPIGSARVAEVAPNALDTKFPARHLDKELVRTIQSRNCDEHRREWLKAEQNNSGTRSARAGDPHAATTPVGLFRGRWRYIGVVVDEVFRCTDVQDVSFYERGRADIGDGEPVRFEGDSDVPRAEFESLRASIARRAMSG